VRYPILNYSSGNLVQTEFSGFAGIGLSPPAAGYALEGVLGSAEGGELGDMEDAIEAF
jgi:hypothetical protein